MAKDTIYLNDLDDLDLNADEISVLTMVYNASDEVAVFSDEDNYGLIGLEFAIRILTQFDDKKFSERGQEIKTNLLNELVNEQIKLGGNEADDEISFDELMLKMQSDMAELSGEDLAELAGHLGINVKYQSDSIFILLEKN